MWRKQSSDLVKFFIALLDVGLITSAFYIAYWARFGSFQGVTEFIWLCYFSAPITLILLLRYRVLTGFRYQSLSRISVSTLLAFIMSGLICSTILYLTKTAEYSRLVFGYYFSLATLFVLLEKILVKKLFERYLRNGGMNIRVAMLGFGSKFESVAASIAGNKEWGVRAVLSLDIRDESVKSLVNKIRKSIIDEVYIIYPRAANYDGQVDKLIAGIEKLGIPIRVASNYDELQGYYGQYFSNIAKVPAVLLAPYNLDPDQVIIKRLVDIVGALVGLAILFLILPIVALSIKLSSPGPVFFSQVRVGKSGRHFKIYKFRSMYIDAEERKAELTQFNVHEGHIFKMDDDPRITPVGRFLRKYSIDEVPQFWNVLIGDMSLVGTRPPTKDEVAGYEDHHFRRISIKPGITGLWQVSGRNDITDFDDVVALDVEYIRNWGLLSDMKIILRTITTVLFPKSGSRL
ncbi:sugar transferase [Parahaliea sp. F7430]|uniref:Sugar transferase n=1 Tax=Sediminihaliea albiluteola TaxID=2758564 RepID=A0A7W2TY31_9GAMM|nr:sugar transferase [Sediminihaliea albiluteola]MBA6414068.1 sugar transferase [Sediminihaliea albiluteola]